VAFAGAQQPQSFDRAREAFTQAMREPDLERRRTLLDSSLAASPSFEAHYAMGNLLLDQRQYPAARASFKSALALASGDKPAAAALFKAGLTCEKEGNTLEAIAWLVQSLERLPDPTVDRELKRIRLAAAEQVQPADAIDSTLAVTKSFGKPATLDLHINFEFDRAVLDPRGRQQADELGKLLARKSTPDYHFLLIGHTDLKGSPEYNFKLSKGRADAVKSYLVERYPIAVKRVRTEGRGFREPLYRESSPENDRLNRRVELRLVRAR
jgi:outer membrane protein OmpA-like peptidoglycan-associated protein